MYLPKEEAMFLQGMKCVRNSQSRDYWLLIFGYYWKMRFLKGKKFKLCQKEIAWFW